MNEFVLNKIVSIARSSTLKESYPSIPGVPEGPITPLISPINRVLGIIEHLLYFISIGALVYFLASAIKYTYLIYKGKKDNFDTKELQRKRKKSIIIGLVTSIITSFSGMILDILRHTSAKPIIYIYPKKDGEKVKVKLGKPENLTCTYPQYKDEWNVIANKNGDLFDEETGKHYYALYWEGKNYGKLEFKEGFVVKGEDSAKFLEEKLEILGLNEREAEEFIVYWLPKLEKNKYNLIRFQAKEAIDESMGLEITPKPDTIIRVMMTFKPLKNPIEIPEQKLERIQRKGYTVVEWGGILNK